MLQISEEELIEFIKEETEYRDSQDVFEDTYVEAVIAGNNADSNDDKSYEEDDEEDDD